MQKRKGCLISIVCCLSLPVLLYLLNEAWSFYQCTFNPETKGIVKVVTECDGGIWKEEGKFIYTIAHHNRIQASDPFEADKMDVYNASSCLSSSVENGKVVNHINTVRILDENREEVEVTQEFDDIVHLAAQIDHDVMVLKILKTEAHTFVYTELNVNLRTPCTLYYYNPETRSLAQLHEWDDEKVTLIKVINPELLKDLRPKYCLNPSAVQQLKPMFLKIISFLIP